jgi:uncharacterized membrane protein
MSSPRRQLTLAVLVAAAAAGLALYAASRTWRVEVTVRPAPLPAVRTARPGGALLPVLPALALVGLAGAGALLATRGRGRTAVGVLVLVSGLGMVGAAAYALAALDGVGAGWPVVCGLAGAAVAAVGAVALRRGRAWPGLGTRYERRAPAEPALWDALDRGEDPTGS